MPLKRSKNLSKRVRLEDARAQLRATFEGSPVARHAERPASADELRQAWELAGDIEQFARDYLSHYLTDQETGAPIEPAAFHREIYQLILTEQRLAVAAPREHAKSTVAAFLFVLYCICYKLRWFILLLSDTEPQATLLLNAVKEELETNDKLRADFGDLVNDRKWGERDIVTVTGIRVSARGAGQSLRGLRFRWRRPDLVICDDLENDQDVENPESRAKLKGWFRKTVLNLGKKCQVVVVGTILHYDSLLAELVGEEHFPAFTKRMYVAVDDEWSEGSVLWPGKWPLEALRTKLTDIGLVEFDQEFRNRPINQQTQVFREAWFKQHAFTWDELRGIKLVKIGGNDPAISEKQKADFFGSVTIGIQPDGRICVLRGEQRKMPFAAQLDFLVERARNEKQDAIAIETVAYQRALKQALDKRLREERLPIPVLEVEAKGDKFMRISTLSPLVENGTIRFCLDGTQDTLIKQLLFLGKMKDDIADALHIAIAAARTLSWKGVMVCADPAPHFPRGAEPRRPSIWDSGRVAVASRAPEESAGRGQTGSYTQRCPECSRVVSAFYYGANDELLKVRQCKHCGAALPPLAVPPQPEVPVGYERRRFGGLRP